MDNYLFLVSTSTNTHLQLWNRSTALLDSKSIPSAQLNSKKAMSHKSLDAESSWQILSQTWQPLLKIAGCRFNFTISVFLNFVSATRKIFPEEKGLGFLG
jgi:hypothetical protein